MKSKIRTKFKHGYHAVSHIALHFTTNFKVTLTYNLMLIKGYLFYTILCLDPSPRCRQWLVNVFTLFAGTGIDAYIDRYKMALEEMLVTSRNPHCQNDIVYLVGIYAVL